MKEEVVWFDISEYGYTRPFPVLQPTLQEILDRAEILLANDLIKHDDFYMDTWFDFLKTTSPYGNEQWNIMVLLHMAIQGLRGVKQPQIIDPDDLDDK